MSVCLKQTPLLFASSRAEQVVDCSPAVVYHRRQCSLRLQTGTCWLTHTKESHSEGDSYPLLLPKWLNIELLDLSSLSVGWLSALVAFSTTAHIHVCAITCVCYPRCYFCQYYLNASLLAAAAINAYSRLTNCKMSGRGAGMHKPQLSMWVFALRVQTGSQPLSCGMGCKRLLLPVHNKHAAGLGWGTFTCMNS